MLLACTVKQWVVFGPLLTALVALFMKEQRTVTIACLQLCLLFLALVDTILHYSLLSV